MGIDLDRIEAAIRELILAIGEDPDREGLLKTPRRVADMFAEVFSGIGSWENVCSSIQIKNWSWKHPLWGNVSTGNSLGFTGIHLGQVPRQIDDLIFG